MSGEGSGELVLTAEDIAIGEERRAAWILQNQSAGRTVRRFRENAELLLGGGDPAAMAAAQTVRDQRFRAAYAALRAAEVAYDGSDESRVALAAARNDLESQNYT